MPSLATKMAIVWFCLFTFAALGNSIITAFYGMRWVDMDWQDRIMVGILILVNWFTTMMAFLSKAMSRAQHGEFPISEGDTQLLQKSGDYKQVTTATTVVETKPTEEKPKED